MLNSMTLTQPKRPTKPLTTECSTEDKSDSTVLLREIDLRADSAEETSEEDSEEPEEEPPEAQLST
jgi:hypothetical protein